MTGRFSNLEGLRERRRQLLARIEDGEKRETELAALLVERAGYVARNLPERVAQVDEQIRLRGGKPPRPGRKEAGS